MEDNERFSLEKPTWKEFLSDLIVAYCERHGCRTFTRQEFLEDCKHLLEEYAPEAASPSQTMSRILQELRDEGFLIFGESRGTYTLVDTINAPGELLEEAAHFEISAPSIDATQMDKLIYRNKREYHREIYVRDRGIISKAKERFGCYCLYPKCENTFDKPDGIPYIEVHHIVPLFENGEDELWNLAVVCAHHHKMAHFADVDTRSDLQKKLLKIVDSQF